MKRMAEALVQKAQGQLSERDAQRLARTGLEPLNSLGDELSGLIWDYLHGADTKHEFIQALRAQHKRLDELITMLDDELVGFPSSIPDYH